MTGVISPVVYGNGLRWFYRGALPHILGAAIGGSALALLLATASLVLAPITREYGRLFVFVIAVGTLLIIGRVVPWQFPTLSRQVPRGWQVSLGPSFASFAYGAVLGFGLATVIYSPLFHLSVIASLVLVPPAWAWTAVAFGLVRAVSHMVAASQVSGADLRSLDLVLRRMKALARWKRALQIGVVAMMFVWLLIDVR